MRRLLLVVAVVVAVGLLSTAPASAAVAAPPPARWVRPVPGPVVRPFEPPPTPYSPGHRGADLAIATGEPVHVAGAGLVTFAGAVAGALHVTVAHDRERGLRTSYSFLADVAVREGERVAAGEVIGHAGGPAGDHPGGVLHLGLRRGDRYLDPMVLFEPVDLTRLIRLVPPHPPRLTS